MTYYFTSKTPDLKTAEGAKLTENKMISAFCLANPLAEPWNWFRNGCCLAAARTPWESDWTPTTNDITSGWM